MAAKKNKSLVSKVAKRVGVAAREIRDVPTAIGTLGKTIANVKPDRVAITPTAKSQRAINQAGSNLGKQLKEVGSAIVSGKSGTTSAQSKVKREVIAGKKRQASTPAPKFTAPSLQDFKKSAAYKTNSLTYKEYVAIAQDVYKERLKRRQGR
jgi:hypothetical protein